ncbi:ABC transporter substrate-binding protein [Desulforamulus ruminis]|uniref:ABC transporter substrate-binding protein n=1 Tax=Desulforamulus ruminis TaxID=1564 RepID=UPI00235244DE|nr:ABC transporter substrate-binding protein [Desulforamulus ruminis]
MSSKKRIVTLCAVAFSLLLIAVAATGCGSSDNGSKDSSEDMPKIRVSHQPEFETFLTYRAIQEGLDKKNGVSLELKFFDSGMPQVEALPANEWDVGATGGVPAIMAALRYDAYIIGIADDESLANVVMARPDSPLLKGESPKGKNILVTTVSSGHYALSQYLKSSGLSDKDVTIQNLEQAQAVAAFDSGKGDAVALWAPFMYTGLQKGWEVVASGDKVGAKIPLVLIANKKFADEHPDQVVKFLDIYFQKIDEMKKEGSNLATDYQAFLKDWAGMEVSAEDAKLDIENHPVFTLEEQLKMFDSSQGNSEVYQWMDGIATFFTEQGKFKPEEKEKVMQSPFINDKFLKMLAKEKGLIQ